MLTTEKQSQLDKLSVTIGAEQNVRDQLRDIDREIDRHHTELLPLESKQQELLGKLAAVDAAKKEAAAIKRTAPKS